jgi:magnesium transporter
MIEIIKGTKEGIKHQANFEKGCWINVTNPTHEELSQLKDLIELNEEMILSLQDKEEMPTLEEENNQLFIILRTPNKVTDLKYTTVPLGIIVKGDYLITLCFHKNDLLEKIKQHLLDFTKEELILKIMLHTSKTFLNFLNEINATTDSLESQIYKSQKNKEIVKLLGLEQSLVYFSTSLQLNEVLVSKFSTLPEFKKTANYKELISTIQDETRQAIGMAKIYTNILSNLMDAFASLISNNLNIVMKLLTSITILMAVPTLIASIYGMNVELPFQRSPHAFVIVMIMSLLFSGIFLWFFSKHDMI